jgi:hypothetical protein
MLLAWEPCIPIIPVVRSLRPWKPPPPITVTATGESIRIVRFGDRHGDAGDINFLKRVLPDEAFSNIYFFRNAMKNLHGWFTDSQLVLIDKTSTYAYNTNGR